MFSENQKISGRQFNRMMALDLFAGAVMLLPKFLVRTCGGQGIYAVAAGTLAVLVYGGLLYYVSTRYSDSFFEFTKRTLGKGIAWAVLVYFMIRFLFAAVYLLKMFSQVINRTFLTEMPEKFIAALMIITALYGAFRGIEARGRQAGILIWFIAVPVFIIVLLSMTEIRLPEIFPMTLDSGAEVVRGGLAVVSVFSMTEFVLFASPYVRNKKKGFHFLAKAILFAAVTAGVIYLACIGVMTVNGARSELWPTVILMQIIRLPGKFISRQDGLMLMFWIASAFMAVGGYIFYADEIVRQMFPKYYFKGVLALWIAVVYGAFCMIKDYRNFEQFYFKMTLWGGIVPTVVIMLVLLVKCRWDGGKRK